MYIGRSDSRQSCGYELQGSQTFFFPDNCASTCFGAWLIIWAWQDTWSLILFFFSISFLSIQVSGISCQEETPQWARQCLRETLLYPHGFFRFPVCSAGESFSTSRQNGAAATRPHCLLHTDLILQLQWDLLHCYYRLPCFFPLLFCQYVFFGCSNTHLWMEAWWAVYLSVVRNNDQLDVFGCLLSMPFMLK